MNKITADQISVAVRKRAAKDKSNENYCIGWMAAMLEEALIYVPEGYKKDLILAGLEIEGA